MGVKPSFAWTFGSAFLRVDGILMGKVGCQNPKYVMSCMMKVRGGVAFHALGVELARMKKSPRASRLFHNSSSNSQLQHYFIASSQHQGEYPDIS